MTYTTRTHSTPLGSAFWLLVSAAILVWAASTVVQLLNAAGQAVAHALGQ